MFYFREMTLKHGCHGSGQGEIIFKVNEKLGNFIFQGREVETLKQNRRKNAII